MAIIQCPACQRRISSLAKACPHCGVALATQSAQDMAQSRQRRLDQQLFQWRNLTYLAMAIALAGMGWWLFAGPDQAEVAAVLIAVGGLAYVLCRVRMLWLQSQLKSLRQTQRRL